MCMSLTQMNMSLSEMCVIDKNMCLTDRDACVCACQVFGDISVPGMDKDIKKALERGSRDLQNLSASRAQLNKVSWEIPPQGGDEEEEEDRAHRSVFSSNSFAFWVFWGCFFFNSIYFDLFPLAPLAAVVWLLWVFLLGFWVGFDEFRKSLTESLI